MSERMTNVEIEDVLTSIRRLVAEGQGASAPARTEAADAAPRPDKLVLTPALRVTEPDGGESYPAEANAVAAEDTVDDAGEDEADEAPMTFVWRQDAAPDAEQEAEAPEEETGWSDEDQPTHEPAPEDVPLEADPADDPWSAEADADVAGAEDAEERDDAAAEISDPAPVLQLVEDDGAQATDPEDDLSAPLVLSYAHRRAARERDGMAEGAAAPDLKADEPTARMDEATEDVAPVDREEDTAGGEPEELPRFERAPREGLEAKIAALEAAVNRQADTGWEPDGSEIRRAPAAWPDVLYPPLSEVEDAEEVAEDAQHAEEAAEDVATAPDPAAEEIAFRHDERIDPLAALRGEADARILPEDDLENDPDLHSYLEHDAVIDEAALRALVIEIVREELQGRLGERITQNVRKLVRREIMRILNAQEG